MTDDGLKSERRERVRIEREETDATAGEQHATKARQWERAAESDRSHDEFQRRELRDAAATEREREYFAYSRRPGGATHGSGVAQMGKEMERLVSAVTRANTQLIMGVAQVIGNLLLGINNSIWGKDIGLWTPQGAYQSPGSWVGRTADVIGGISDDLGHAMRDTANVVSRSAENFARVYEGETIRDHPLYSRRFH